MPYDLQVGAVTPLQATRSGWPNPQIVYGSDLDTILSDGDDSTFIRSTQYRQDSSWFTGSSNLATAPVINATGPSSNIDGMTWNVRLRASNDLGEATSGFYMDMHDPDFNVEIDYYWDDAFPADGEWHDRTITWSAADIVAWGTDPDDLWAAMVAGTVVVELWGVSGRNVAPTFTRTVDYAQVGPTSAVAYQWAVGVIM